MAIMRRIREKLKKAIQEKRESRIAKKKPLLSRAKVKAQEAKEEHVLGSQEVAVGKTKFSTPEASRVAPPIVQELPGGYNQDRVVLQVRDSRWIHAYWELTWQTIDSSRQRLGDAFHSAKRVLRIYDVSNIIFSGNNAHRYFDIEVGPDANNWYIDTNGPGRSWCVDLGVLLPDGRFITLIRSNTVYTPLEGPSWITDEEWMIPEDMFARLYGMGFGFGRSSPVGKAWQERIRRALFSGVLASPGMASMASPTKQMPKERKFWMVVNTELIVYGATQPDAKVTLQGRPLNLRSDGTFTARFALPDGKQVIPVEATSADGIETRTITPIVARETKHHSVMREEARHE